VPAPPVDAPAPPAVVTPKSPEASNVSPVSHEPVAPSQPASPAPAQGDLLTRPRQETSSDKPSSDEKPHGDA
jgi:ribonuclease E